MWMPRKDLFFAEPICIKVSEYTFRGSNSVIFTFASLLKRGLPLRKEFAPLGANSFLKSKPHFGRAMSVKKANRKSLKLFPIVKMGAKHEVYHMH